MDPIAATLLGAALWFVFGDIFIAVLVWGTVILVTLLGSAVDKVWVLVVGYILAFFVWVGAVIIVWYNIISHVVTFGRLVGWWA